MEINKKELLNPINQDIKKDKLRYVKNVYPYHGYIWNYGALPQTFEDPTLKDDETGCFGDNDPLDLIEIGTKTHQRGSVIKVKVLGALGLIDEGEADWKIVAIDTQDPLANTLNDINDVNEHLPGLLESTRQWFRLYKIPDGKPANSFAADGKFFNRDFAINQINHDHLSWKNLIKNNNHKNISLINTTLDKHNVSSEKVATEIESNNPAYVAQPAQIDIDSLNTIYYVK